MVIHTRGYIFEIYFEKWLKNIIKNIFLSASDTFSHLSCNLQIPGQIFGCFWLHTNQLYRNIFNIFERIKALLGKSASHRCKQMVVVWRDSRWRIIIENNNFVFSFDILAVFGLWRPSNKLMGVGSVVYQLFNQTLTIRSKLNHTDPRRYTA